MHGITTRHRFEVGVHEGNEYGYFEHEEYGEELGGGLWFENNELIEFDGVMLLPDEVADILQSLGFKVDKKHFCT